MHIGGAMFFTDYSMSPTELARALEERGFEFAVGARALAHSADAQVALPQRRRSAEEILRRDGPVRGAECGRGGDQDADARHRHLPGRPARPDPDRQAGRLDRPGLGRPFPVRHRQRLERGRDGQPRHRFRKPPQAGARAHRGDEGDLDQVKGRVPWRVREFRPDDDLAEAGPEAASADHRRRRLPVRRAARPALRRRLDAAPHAQPVCRRAGPAAEIPRDGSRGGPRSRVGADHDLGRQGEPRPAQARPRRWRLAPGRQPRFRPRPIRSCRNSTAGRR